MQLVFGSTVSKQIDICIYLRNDAKNPGCWGLPGGKVDGKENLSEAIQRECQEEIGIWPEIVKLSTYRKIYQCIDNHFSYHTFFCLINNEFTTNTKQRTSRLQLDQIWRMAKTVTPGLMDNN